MWYKMYNDTEKSWEVYNGDGITFFFENENMADLMLFCLDRIVS